MACCGPLVNLTPEFIRLRSACKERRERFGTPLLGGPFKKQGKDYHDSLDSPPSNFSGRQGLLSNSGFPPISLNTNYGVNDRDRYHADVEMTTSLPPVWVDLIEDVHSELQQAKEKLSALQKLQQKRLLHVFGDSATLQQPEKEVEALSAIITQILRRCEEKIQRIGFSTGVPSKDNTDAELRKNAQKSLATQMQAVLQQMRKQQNHYASELRKRHQLDEKQQDDEPKYFRDVSSTVDQEAVQELERMSDTRVEEITKLAQSIAELHTLFQQLNLLVIDQGTILDRIDFNIENVAAQAQQGVKHLHKAESYHRSGRAGKVIWFLILMIILLVGLVFI